MSGNEIKGLSSPGFPWTLDTPATYRQPSAYGLWPADPRINLNPETLLRLPRSQGLAIDPPLDLGLGWAACMSGVRAVTGVGRSRLEALGCVSRVSSGQAG